MKINKKARIRHVAAGVAAVAALTVLAAALFLLSSGALFSFHPFVFDHSAEARGQDAIYWNGSLYTVCGGVYREGKTIATTSDGGWDLNEVEEDPSHTFLVMRSFLDQYLLVSGDYEIPTAGNVTAVSWGGGEQITDELFCQTVSEIVSKAQGRFTYETDGVSQLTDGQHLRQVFFAYENCPVTTSFIGYMGTLNDQWIITTHVSHATRPSGAPGPDTVQYAVIPDEYIEILEPYFP